VGGHVAVSNPVGHWFGAEGGGPRPEAAEKKGKKVAIGRAGKTGLSGVVTILSQDVPVPRTCKKGRSSRRLGIPEEIEVKNCNRRGKGQHPPSYGLKK